MNAQVVPHTSLLAGANVLIQGGSGAGKTHSLGTLVEYCQANGLEFFLMALEPGYESLLGYFTDRGKPIPDCLHWHHLARGQEKGLDALTKKVEQIGKMSQEALHSIKDMTRSTRNYYFDMLTAMKDFPCQRTGETFGNVFNWGTNRVFAMDSLSGLGNVAMSLVVGTKPTKSQPDWGIAQDIMEEFLRQMCEAARCHFVLLAHIEREKDEISGGTKITVSAPGQKLAPKIPPLFSDVIQAYRNGTEFLWSTAAPQADLKTRNLPLSEKIPPDFAQIFNRWQSRGGRFVP